jgi:hypothetical protein
MSTQDAGTALWRVTVIIFLVGLVGLGVGFFAWMSATDVMVWALGAFMTALVCGLIFARLWEPATAIAVAVVGLAALLVAIVLIAWGQATSSVVQGGVPPVPPNTMNTPIGWFTPRFWSVVTPAMGWVAISGLPYLLGVALGRRRRTR